MTQGNRYHKLRKTFEKFLRSYSELLSKFGTISFQYILRNHSPGFLRWSCLQTKEGHMRHEFNLVGLENRETPSTSSYDPTIVERTFGLVLCPFEALIRILERCILINKAVGTIRMTGLVLTYSETTGSWSPSPRDSFSLWTWARVQTVRSTAFFKGWTYIFLIYYYYIRLCNTFYYLSALVGCWSSVS